MTASILHVDMDAFFAEVELLDRPELRGRPALVARDTGRSVVTSATYEARRYGIHSAMPVAAARRLCPDVLLLEPHFEKYRHYSAIVMEIFSRVTPLVEPLSIDEAFLDVSGAVRRLGQPADIAAAIKSRVRKETGLPCSVGVAATKFVAKLASGRAKPDGLLVVEADKTLAFLHPLPLSALWGVGAKTQDALGRLGLRTVGDLADTPVEVVRRFVGDAAGSALHNLSRGIDPRVVDPQRQVKSVGHETTFEHDVTDDAALRRELLRLSDHTAARLRRSQVAGRTVVLKLRYADFTTITRSRSLAEPTAVGRSIYETVQSVFDSLERTRPVRLIGVRVEQISDSDGSTAVLWDPDEDWRLAEIAVDGVARRFGADAVRPASLLARSSRQVGDTSSLSATEDP